MGALSEMWQTHPAVTGGPNEIVALGVEHAARSLESSIEEPGQWRVHQEGHRAWLVRGGQRLEFIQPLPHQMEALHSEAATKLLRWGRRAGKTRVAWYCLVNGHGPVGTWSQGVEPFVETWTGHRHRGILSGKDVVWVARDHKQADVIWLEEIRKKLKGHEGVRVNEVERSVTFEGHGTLFVRSNENIDSVRGIGDNLIGVIIDEAAHLDLEYALKEVLLPALMDNEGWVVVISTTNAGKDGNKERPTGPSYFNMLCQDVLDGAKDPAEYFENHRTARDNPRITPAAFAKLKSEYVDNSHSWAQEGEAKLLKGLYGLMFTEWRDDLHVQDFDVTALTGHHWRAGLDWGFSSPGWFGLGAFGPKEREHLHAEYSFNGHADPQKNLPPYEVGRNIGRLLLNYPKPDRIDADDAMWQTGDGRGGRRKSDAEKCQQGINEILGNEAPRLWKAAKGKGSRGARVRLFHQSLRFHEVEEERGGQLVKVVPAWAMPKFSVHSRCVHFRRSVPALPVSPVDPDDVDTTADDHPFDGWTYLTQSRPSHSQGPAPRQSEHQHPGLGRYLQPQGPPAHEPRWQRTA